MKTHRTYRFLTALVSFILLLTLGCLPILAAEDLLPQNQAAADETAAKFSALITHYDGKEASSTIPADRAIEVIGLYAAEAAALISSDTAAARTEDLRPAFSLLYQKGELAAKITWIAYAHGVMDTQSDAAALREQYATLTDDIRNMADEDTLTSHADGLCIAMNRAVFKAKINRLPRELGIRAHLLSHRHAGNRNGRREDRNESGVLCSAEALAKGEICYSKSKNGHYNAAKKRARDNLFFQRGYRRKLKLRAKHNKRHRRRYI